MFCKAPKTAQVLGSTQMSNKLVNRTRCSLFGPQGSEERPLLCTPIFQLILCCPLSLIQGVPRRQFLVVIVGSTQPGPGPGPSEAFPEADPFREVTQVQACGSLVGKLGLAKAAGVTGASPHT